MNLFRPKLSHIQGKRLFTSYDTVLKNLGVHQSSGVIQGVFDGEQWKASGEIVECVNPSTGECLAKVQLGTAEDMKRCIHNAKSAQKMWRSLPAPIRGNIVREIGNELRAKKKDLGMLLSLEMGKILTEGEGEVQEFIDICDFASGLSRNFHGQILPSERQDHSLLEVYNPLGTIGIISAFNFPHAVVGWNTAISLVCGNTQIVKGSESANLISIATQRILLSVLEKHGVDQKVATLCQGRGNEVGNDLVTSRDVGLISFTGSTETGKKVQQKVSERFGKTILELGGNNAVIISDKCEDLLLKNALNSVLFAAVGTCGQRCTSLRRLLVHESVYERVKKELTEKYDFINNLANKKIGNPVEKGTLVGPLHSKKQVEDFQKKVKEVEEQGGRILSGGKLVDFLNFESSSLENGNFVYPTLVEIDHEKEIVFEENFMPLLHLIKISSVEEGIELNNSVQQGLSSSLFTSDMCEVWQWIGVNGSDTGIVNVNTGCSGAEIGLAFGGNKATGWGRESGSDAWKQYMRRASCTVNFGKTLTLAQGVDFS